MEFSEVVVPVDVPVSRKQECWLCVFLVILAVHRCLFNLVIGVAVQCYLIMVLFYISLLTKDVKHLCTYVWAFECSLL